MWHRAGGTLGWQEGTSLWGKGRLAQPGGLVFCWESGQGSGARLEAPEEAILISQTISSSLPDAPVLQGHFTHPTPEDLVIPVQSSLLTEVQQTPLDLSSAWS